jgi:hypothetical protein
MSLTTVGFKAWLTIARRSAWRFDSEVRFKWHNVHQYRPVPLQVVREIWKARPMNAALQELVMKNRRIRFGEVRSEEKLLVSLLRGWAMIAP